MVFKKNGVTIMPEFEALYCIICLGDFGEEEVIMINFTSCHKICFETEWVYS